MTKKHVSISAIYVLAVFVTGWFVPSVSALDFEVKKIWDAAPHNAFTDLALFDGELYCTFREGINHVPRTREEDGGVRVIKSKDGEHWESAALIQKSGYDLRDSKISVTPDGRLMLIMGGSRYVGGVLKARHPHVSFSDKDGNAFSEAQPILVEDSIRTEWDWLWRVTWHEGIAYGVIYREEKTYVPGGTYTAGLVKSTDGENYVSVKEFDLSKDGSAGYPDEATIRFDRDDKMYILLRRGLGPGRNTNGLFGRSVPPYTDWTWTDAGKKLGGPEFCFLPSGNILVADRAYDADGLGTALYKKGSDGKLIEIARFPGRGNDTGYPGIVVHNGVVWVSYYSSHEGKASIYLVKLRLEDVEAAVR